MFLFCCCCCCSCVDNLPLPLCWMTFNKEPVMIGQLFNQPLCVSTVWGRGGAKGKEWGRAARRRRGQRASALRINHVITSQDEARIPVAMSRQRSGAPWRERKTQLSSPTWQKKFVTFLTNETVKASGGFEAAVLNSEAKFQTKFQQERRLKQTFLQNEPWSSMDSNQLRTLTLFNG